MRAETKSSARLAKTCASRAQLDLAGQILILISHRYPSRIRIDEAFEHAGLGMTARVETAMMAAACGGVEAGLGIALVNALMAAEFSSAKLVNVPFRPVIKNRFGILLPLGSGGISGNLAQRSALRSRG
ncbi:MAG TPA: LysR substrate-binding domain-containing protein [Mesorhizobium sp.]|nr:LysR substrate-binding domain-containing protein [Mesorhizobium sp.]